MRDGGLPYFVGQLGMSEDWHVIGIEKHVMLPIIEPVCRGFPGSVSIERNDDSLCKADHSFYVVVGEGCAAGGDRSIKSCAEASNDIGVALADDDFVGLHDLFLRPVKTIEHFTFVI